MNKLLSAYVISTALVLSGCGGGGGSSSPCGSAYQIFTIDFASSSYTLRVGTAGSIASTVQPESCRSNMHFSDYVGYSKPAGLSISNGNLVGTPTTAGTYTYRMAISSVDGYQTLSSTPYSRIITITVQP